MTLSRSKQERCYEELAVAWFCAVCGDLSFTKSVQAVQERYPRSAESESFLRRARQQYAIWGRESDEPRRIQLQGLKGWRMPFGSKKVARPTRWGNPFKLDEQFSPEAIVMLYREWLGQPEQSDLVRQIRNELRGDDLACYCPLDQSCHADVLLQVAN